MPNIEDIIKSYTKRFGKEEIKIGSELQKIKEEVISTGILTLDYALGIGGIPMGKIIEMYGQESSGKTSLALIIAGQMQKSGKLVAFIDAESSFDPNWAVSLGCDIDKLLVVEANSLEDSLEKLQFLIMNGVSFIVYDSIVAPPTESQNVGDYGDAQIGVRARILSSALSKLLPVMRNNKATVLFINQLREKVGVYGNPETTPGGRALKYFSSLRLNLRKKVIKESDEFVGDEIYITIEKNKFAPPLKKAKFILFYDGTYVIDYVELATNLGILIKAGAWYRDEVNQKQFHGGQNFINALLTDKEYKQKIDEEILKKLKGKNLDEVIKDEE